MAFSSSFFTGWELIAVAAASLSVVAAAMLIMLSRAFSMRNLEQTAKTEFVYAVSTVLIVIMIALIVQLGEPLLASGSPLPGGHSSVAKSLYISSFTNPVDGKALDPQDPMYANLPFKENSLIDWMILYMQTPAQCVSQFMKVLYYLSIPVEAIASVYMEIFMSEVASGFGVKWLSERIATATKSMSFYMYIYYLLVHLFHFIEYYAGFFFSVGVAMRAFPPTRGAGAFMMAISIGLYFVFPLTYILAATLSLPHIQTVSLGIDPNPPPDADPIAYTCILPAAPIDPASYACQSPSFSTIFESLDRYRANYDNLYSMVTYRINDFTVHLASVICLFPTIAMVVFLTFTLNAANLFGGNIPEIGRGLVKLI